MGTVSVLGLIVGDGIFSHSLYLIFNPEVLLPEADLRPSPSIQFSFVCLSKLPIIRWPSLQIHIIEKEKRAQVRPTCLIFEQVEPWKEPQPNLR
jgi:hypothetical protein